MLATAPQPAVNVPTHASAPHTPPATSQAPSATSQTPSAISQTHPATAQAPSATSQAPSATSAISQGHSTQLPGFAHVVPQATADGQHADSAEADVPAATKLESLSEKPETAPATQRAANESASSDATSSEAAQAAAVHEIPHNESWLGSSQSAADSAQPCSSSSSSGRSESDSQPSTPVSDRSAAQASAQSSQISLGSVSQLDQQVAVLSLLAGVAADPASPLTHPQSLRSAHAEASPYEHQPSSRAAEVSTEEQSFPPADVSSAGTSSGPASESSLDIYDALREDRGNRNDWHVVKAGRKSGLNTTKVVDKSTDLPPAPDQQQQPGMSHRGRLAESSLRSQDGGAEAGAHGVSGEVGQSGKTVRRCSSGASISSWNSAEAVETMDRYAERGLLGECVNGRTKERTTAFGVNLMRSQVLYQAAQESRNREIFSRAEEPLQAQSLKCKETSMRAMPYALLT